MSKGVIKFQDRARQLNDFSGLVRMRGITPTDIDGFIDYNSNAFLFLEGKYYTAETPIGQRRSYESLCDTINKTGKLACAIIYTHKVPVIEDVKVSKCQVSEVYWGKRWHIEARRTVEEFIDAYEEYAQSLAYRI